MRYPRTSRALRLAVSCTALLLTVSPLFAGPPDEIGRLIQQLGSESFQAREEATHRLMQMPKAAAALRAARKTPDAEVACRASEILAVLASAEEKAAMTKLARFAKEGNVGQLVEVFVRRERWGDEEGAWQVMSGLVDKLLAIDERTNGGPITLDNRVNPVQDFRKFAAATHPQMVAGRRPYLDKHRFFAARGDEITVAPDVACGYFVSGGALSAHALISSVLFAGGSVEVDHVTHCIVICDGDFTARRGAASSLILARGDVISAKGMASCHIAAAGRFRYGRGVSIPATTKLKENELTPFNFVRFFDPADVGIKAESAEGGVRVKSAEKGKPFAAAGVRADDLITSVNGQAVKDAESFRRLLRASLAVDGDTVLKVRRDKQVREVRVPAPK